MRNERKEEKKGKGKNWYISSRPETDGEVQDLCVAKAFQQVTAG